jgi:hypothetical protein
MIMRLYPSFSSSHVLQRAVKKRNFQPHRPFSTLQYTCSPHVSAQPPGLSYVLPASPRLFMSTGLRLFPLESADLSILAFGRLIKHGKMSNTQRQPYKYRPLDKSKGEIRLIFVVYHELLQFLADTINKIPKSAAT